MADAWRLVVRYHTVRIKPASKTTMNPTHPISKAPSAAGSSVGCHYRIRVKGCLSHRWADWFGGLELIRLPNGETLLAGQLADQSALHGVLARIRDLNLELIALERIEPPG